MTMPEDPDKTDGPPLLVSLDGALLRTDPLLETFCAALHTDPPKTLSLLLRAPFSPEPITPALAGIALPDPAHLPRRKAVMTLVRHAVAEGRPVTLTSRADPRLVAGVGDSLDLPGPHVGGSSETVARAAALGEGGFDAVFHRAADLPAFRPARKLTAVAPGARLRRELPPAGPKLRIIEDPWAASELLKEMRPRQWIKNILLLLPVLVAHDLSPARLLPVLLAIAAFCCLTSSVYLFNDLLDLDSDRRHPEKRKRPLASGALPIGVALAAIPVLLTVAFLIGAAIAPALAGVMAAYLAVSTLYSLWLKHLRYVDLFALASLYALRVLAGAEAAGLDWPAWPVAFSFAVFFVLSIVKRLTGLARAEGSGKIPGRGYRRSDIKVLSAIAVAVSLLAVGIFLAYTFSPAAAALYDRPALLRLAALPMTVWLLRMVRLGSKGHEDYDTVVFVTHDWPGLSMVAAGTALAIAAI